MWMDAHRIPLCAIDRYLSAFFPSPPRGEHALERFRSFSNPAGSLRIFLRAEDCTNRELLRLVRHKMRFPDFTITFESLHSLLAAQANEFGALLKNNHPEWVRLVRSNGVSQVRVVRVVNGCLFRIVMKEKVAPLWMRMTLMSRVPEGYPATLGLDGFQIKFAVDYS
jgi:hypothetical protein